MNYLYISPDFPPNYKHFSQQLARMGNRVLGIGETAFERIGPELHSCLGWYAQTDLKNPESVRKSVLFLKNKFGSIGMVESHNEFWMPLEAMINTEFGIPGITVADLEKLKLKSGMKKVFISLGLEVAPGEKVTDKDAALRFADRHGFPLILKPDEGVGAFGVMKIETREKLAEMIPLLKGPYFIEKFVDAPMCTFDGLTDMQGNVVATSSLSYGSGVRESVEGGDAFFYTQRKIPPKLDEIGRRIATAFGLKRKFFHFEFFDKGNDVFIPVEINARPPGGSIMDVMNYTIDDDLYRAYAEIVSGKKAEIRQDKKWFVGYAGRKERKYKNTHRDILSTWGKFMVEQAPNPSLFHAGMGVYRYIFRAPDEETVLAIRDYILGI